MRQRISKSIVALAALSVLAGESSAVAGPLAFTGELALAIGGFNPIAIPGAGFALVEPRPGDADHLATIRLEASQFGATGLLVPITDPLARPIYGVVATARNGAGAFSDGGGSLGGVLPVLGLAKVCLFGACEDGAIANLTVPMSVVGQGGSIAASGAVNVTVVGAPWTTRAVSIGTITARGFARGPGSGTSSTLQPSGSIRLVTPIFISTNLVASSVVPAFGILTLRFVPEPGTLVLLGSGLAALVAGGAQRRAASR